MMTNVCTLIIVDGDTVSVKHNMKKHHDMVRGWPWVYIDEDNKKYYPIWSSKDNNVHIVEAKGGERV